MVTWTLQAKEDLKAIHDYIARDSKFYAKIVTTGILNKSNYLSKYPFRGRKAPETNDPQIRNKLKYLNRDERLLLYYFQLLDLRDKEDILDFMKLKSHKRPHVPDEKRD